MYYYGAIWTGTDISPEQIEQAMILAETGNMQICFRTLSAEQIDFPDASFDRIPTGGVAYFRDRISLLCGAELYRRYSC
jgi:ubiquinone/menaquinone biosynthesis C-methylase UbiE